MEAMEVLSSDDSDDFQLPRNFDELVSLAPSSVSTLQVGVIRVCGTAEFEENMSRNVEF